MNGMQLHGGLLPFGATFLTFADYCRNRETIRHAFGDCDDIAWPAVYLASDEAKFMTGQVLSPNGGFVMSQ